LDLNDEQQAKSIFEKAFSEYPNIDKIFLISGIGEIELAPSYEVAKSTISLNCSGFTIAAYSAASYLEKRGAGSVLQCV